jgi:hypothetical protein
LYQIPGRVVGKPQAEFAVGAGHVGWIRVAQVCGDVGALLNQILDLLTGQHGLASRLAALVVRRLGGTVGCMQSL